MKRFMAILISGLLPAAVMAADPTTFMGQPIKEITWHVLDHQPVILHVTDSGPIPEQSRHLRFVDAGQRMKKGKDGQPPSFKWQFGLEVLEGAKPAHVAIEDVTGSTAILMVDDSAPQIGIVADVPTWTGEQSSICRIVRGNECASWIYLSGLQLFVFRATVTFEDGSTETLYQGAAFNPEEMKSVWKAFGVER